MKLNKYKYLGESLRAQAKSIVVEYMAQNPECSSSARGLKQAEIFRECGLDWGDMIKATSSNQQYWVVALLRELEQEGCVEQVTESGPWRLSAK